MVTTSVLTLPRPAGGLDPALLEAEIARQLGAVPLRWAITGVGSEHLRIEVAAAQEVAP